MSTNFNLSNKWCYFILALIVLLGLELRLQSVRYTIVDTPVRADAKDYLLYAINLKNFQVYSRSPDAIEGKTTPPLPDALRSPGYPLFMSLFVDGPVSNKTLYDILLAQALLSTLTILLVYAIFSAFLDRPLVLLATLFTAISPHLVTANVFLLSETLFCFLLTLFLWLLSQWRSVLSPVLVLGTGVALALTTLTRPWTQYFIVLLILLILMARHIERPWRGAALLVLSFASLMGLWIGRNLLTLGITSDSTLMINTLHHGLYPGMMYDYRPETLGYPYRFDPRSADIAVSLASVLAEIVHRFREQPLEYLRWYLFGKPVAVFSWDIFEGMGDVFIYPVLRTPYVELWHFKITHWIMQSLHYGLVALAALGSILAWTPGAKGELSAEQRFFIRCIAALFIYFVAMHSIGAPFSRYSIPMQPVVYGLAMFGLWHLAYGLRNLIFKPVISV